MQEVCGTILELGGFVLQVSSVNNEETRFHDELDRDRDRYRFTTLFGGLSTVSE